jgi:glycosyltransferase involved in cell wall biosynthesis
MPRTAPAERPLISAVTPFYNTAPYLAQCIESVLAQTYSHFEYILMDNCSNDGSSEIAENYARRDSRIRFIRCSKFLSQLANYNRALAEISENSQYCKIVAADDYIFPNCLSMMLEAFGKSEEIGLVSSYCLEGSNIKGSGYPFPMPRLSGKEAARQYLRGGPHVFGSPTTVMYRSTLVRHQPPFFNESLLHSDTEKCMEILEHWDFGFAHQILSFLRIDNESVSSTFRPFQPHVLDHYIVVQRYASTFLGAAEAASLKKESKRQYYRVLAKEAIQLRPPEFWRHHRKGLKTLSEPIDWCYLALSVGLQLLWLASNPGMMVRRALRSWKETDRTQQGNQELAASHAAPQ